MWLDKLTSLDMTLIGRLGHKTSTKTNQMTSPLVAARPVFGWIFKKKTSFKIAMSRWVSVRSAGRHRFGGRASGHWALSEVYRLIYLFGKPVHNAVNLVIKFPGKTPHLGQGE